MSTFDHVWGENQRGGGPAFPTEIITGKTLGGEPIKTLGGGISARDYFAAKAPITVADAMLACHVDAFSIGMLEAPRRAEVLAKLAEMRGEYADAMLTERDT